MSIETCLCVLLFGWIWKAITIIFLERLCSCYFPFLLSEKFYYIVKNPKLCSVLISPRRTRTKDSETAPKDRNKLPFLGCIYCIVAFPWLFLEFIIPFSFLILGIIGSDFIYSQFMSSLRNMCLFLYTNIYFLIFITGMPILYTLDYSIGLRRHFK